MQAAVALEKIGTLSVLIGSESPLLPSLQAAGALEQGSFLPPCSAELQREQEENTRGLK